MLLLLGLVLPVLSVAGYVFDLLQGFNRGEFPHWADSLGIPLMSVPIMLLLPLVWAGAHLVYGYRRFVPNVPLRPLLSWRATWFCALITVTAFITIPAVLYSVLVCSSWHPVDVLLRGHRGGICCETSI